jgi:hypothetical protein
MEKEKSSVLLHESLERGYLAVLDRREVAREYTFFGAPSGREKIIRLGHPNVLRITFHVSLLTH